MSEDVTAAMPEWTHPIRIPESVEVTHTEPPFAFAGEISTWCIPFRLSRSVPPGSRLRLQLWGGRNNKIRFGKIQTKRPADSGFLIGETGDGSQLRLRPTDQDGTYVVPVPPGGLEAGGLLTVRLGDQETGSGVKVCDDRVLNKFFVLYLDWGQPKVRRWTDGSVWNELTQRSIVASSTMHVLGGPARSLRAYGPSTVRPGEEFSVLVRPEDAFGNLSHQWPRTVSVSLSSNGRSLAVKTERVTKSTCVRARVSLPAEGVHRLTVRAVDMRLEAITNPVICAAEGERAYWGMIHGHTELSDGTGSIDRYFKQLRDEVRLDFAASSDHDHAWETPDAFWTATCEAVRRWHDPGRFVTLLGYEWAEWRRNGDGDRNVYYLKNDQPIYRADDGAFPSPPDLFGALEENREQALVIPHHTAHGGNFCDWKEHDPRYERLVEIFQITGGYECAAEDGNPVPPRVSTRPLYEKGYVRNALVNGWRVGFTAGGDDHSGHWGSEFCFDYGYKQGLMCVEAAALSREAIFTAMHQRRVVATTGARMLLGYRLNDKPMGSELSLEALPELRTCRRLAVDFHGTSPVGRVDIVRNKTVIHTIPGNGERDLCVEWEDRDPIGDTWLPPALYCDHPFTFYYVRVVQEDGEVAWASPIWIDP